LTSLFGNAAVPHIDASTVSPADKKLTWLPLLTVLFLLSYGLMTMLIVEQGSTIETQRTLIRDLFRDSTELSAVKGKVVQEKNAADAKRRTQTQAPSSQSPANQSRNQDSSTQSESNQTAANQTAQQHRASKKPQLAVPSRPAADLADDRRALITI
jgi:hypothetical protein